MVLDELVSALYLFGMEFIAEDVDFVKALIESNPDIKFDSIIVKHCIDHLISSSFQTLQLPSSLGDEERSMVHKMCCQYGLDSKSYGNGSERRVVISKKSRVSYESELGSVSQRWTVEKARDWYDSHPWMVGCNFLPSNAVNQLEMWQGETFSPELIEHELMLAKSIGFNAVRVFLHDLVWLHDQEGFISRIGQFLNITSTLNIFVILVLFDDCHRPDPMIGQQPLPIIGVHNSQWMQSPGSDIIFKFANNTISCEEINRLREYVTGVLQEFENDHRILLWDLYNEPGRNDYEDNSNILLELVWKWADEIRPSQPLTSCLDGSVGIRNIRTNAINSDIISFHNYQDSSVRAIHNIHAELALGRPIMCTEYMARDAGSTFEHSLPLFKELRVGCFCWGLVAGRSQTHFNWQTIALLEERKSCGLFLLDDDQVPEPPIWYHDIFRPNGEPYSEDEVKYLRSMLLP